MSRVTPPFSVLFAVLALLLVGPGAVRAALYAPGATLDPACAPADPNCGIATSTATIGTGVANNVPYYAADGTTLSATSTLTILPNGNVGVGTTSPGATLAVSGTSLLTGHMALGNAAYVGGNFTFYHEGSVSANTVLLLQEEATDFSNWLTAGQATSLTLNPSAPVIGSTGVGQMITIGTPFGNTQDMVGFSGSYNAVTHEGLGTIGLVSGVNALVRNLGGGTISSSYGINVSVGNLATGTVTNSHGASFISYNGSSNPTTNNYGVEILSAQGVMNNNYGLYIDDQSGAGTDASYNLYSDGVSSKNYFAGAVGIGTTTPWRTLSVDGTVALAGLTTDTADSKVLCLTANNEVVANAGTSCITSSQRFKDNIIPLDGQSGLSEVLKLNPVSFEYKTGLGIPGTQVGFIAEQVQQVDPRLVVLDASSTPFTVRYENLTAVLAKAIQELAGQISALATVVTGFGQKFTTNELCLGSTCLTEAQLKTLLQETGQVATPAPGGGPAPLTNAAPVEVVPTGDTDSGSVSQASGADEGSGDTGAATSDVSSDSSTVPADEEDTTQVVLPSEDPSATP